MAIKVFVPNLGDVSITPNWPNAGAPTSGTTGTLANFSQPGDLLTNTAASPPTLWQNQGTLASPTWVQITIP